MDKIKSRVCGLHLLDRNLGSNGDISCIPFRPLIHTHKLDLAPRPPHTLLLLFHHQFQGHFHIGGSFHIGSSHLLFLTLSPCNFPPFQISPRGMFCCCFLTALESPEQVGIVVSFYLSSLHVVRWFIQVGEIPRSNVGVWVAEKDTVFEGIKAFKICFKKLSQFKE